MRTSRIRNLTALGLALAVPTALVVSPGVAHGDEDVGPVVYAHRGGAGGERTQENTIAAFEKAHQIDPGGIWLEMDTQLTADDVLVVIHDDELHADVNYNPAWNDEECARPVIEMTYVEISACDPDVPTLAEVVERADVDGWRIMVEIKNIPGEANFEPTGATAAAALVDLLAGAEFTEQERLIVQSFYPPSLDQAEILATLAGFDLRSMMLTTAQLPGAPPDTAGIGFPASSNAAYSTIRNYDIMAPDVRSVDLSAETVAGYHALGKEVIVWTANDTDVITQAASWGVDGIITDDPELAYEKLGYGPAD